MPAIYYKYRTDFNNIICATGYTSFSGLKYNELQVFSGTSIHLPTAMYNYRYGNSGIVAVDTKTKNAWLDNQNYIATINVVSTISGDTGGVNGLPITGGTIQGNLTVTGTTKLNGVLDETSTIEYGTPSADPLPTLNLTFTKCLVLGSVSIPLTTVNGFSINWGLTANQLYTFSFSTSNGSPTWYKDLAPNTTKFLNTAQPYLTIAGSGISNLDDSYWVNFFNGTDFVMHSKTRNVTIYLSTVNATYIPRQFSTTLLGINNNNEIYDTGIASTLYGTQFHYITSTGASTSTSTSAVAKATMTTSSLPLGRYRISANWAWLHNSESNSARFDLTLNGSRIGQQLEIEPKDATDIRTETKVVYMLMSGINTIVLRYWNEGGSTTIYDASIELIRVQ